MRAMFERLTQVLDIILRKTRIIGGECRNVRRVRLRIIDEIVLQPALSRVCSKTDLVRRTRTIKEPMPHRAAKHGETVHLDLLRLINANVRVFCGVEGLNEERVIQAPVIDDGFSRINEDFLLLLMNSVEIGRNRLFPRLQSRIREVNTAPTTEKQLVTTILHRHQKHPHTHEP